MSGFQHAVPLDLDGEIYATVIHDTGPDPTNIIKRSDPFHVHVKWETNGSAVPIMAGNFNVAVSFEGFGPITEKSYTRLGIPVIPVSGTHYDESIPVPASDLDVGAYRMIALVTYTNAAGNPGPIAGYSDDVLVQVYP
jgi:hypothetical protein